MKRPPEIAITRLAMYLRLLEDYASEKDAKSAINSSELAHLLDMNPHQIRKDLSYFGKFGERGIGYRIDELKEKIRRILGLDAQWNLCICGMGNLGAALCAYRGFKAMRLAVVVGFDNDPKKVRKEINGVKVHSVGSIPLLVKKLSITMAIIAAPAYAAQGIVDTLVKAGVRAILNFAPVSLSAPAHVKLRNVDLSAELVHLTYFLSAAK